MKTTKHPYLKEILKTTGKVALMATGTLVATAFMFGFTSVLLNAMALGSIAGWITFGAGTLLTAKTLIKDIVTMRQRVKKQQEEEYRQTYLERLRNAVKKLRDAHRRNQVQARQDQPDLNHELTEKQVEKTLPKGKWRMLSHWMANRRNNREAA